MMEHDPIVPAYPQDKLGCLLRPNGATLDQGAMQTCLFFLDGTVSTHPEAQRLLARALDYAGIPRCARPGETTEEAP